MICHSFADGLQVHMSAPQTKYLSYFTLGSHLLEMSKLEQLRTCLNLMTTRQTSCLSPLKELSFSIAYLHQSLQVMLKFPSNTVKNFGFTLDCHLTLNAHVSNTARTCFFEHRRLASIRSFLTSTATSTLVSDFYCQKLTTVNHCCWVLLIMWHHTCNGYRTMQLE